MLPSVPQIKHYAFQGTDLGSASKPLGASEPLGNAMGPLPASEDGVQ